MSSVYVECACEVLPDDPDQLITSVKRDFYGSCVWFRRGQLLQYKGFRQKPKNVIHVKILDWDHDVDSDCVSADSHNQMVVHMVVYHKGEYDLKPVAEANKASSVGVMTQPAEETDSMPQAIAMDLPNEALKNHWERLTYNDNMQFSVCNYLLQLIQRPLEASAGGTCGRLVLFHGPPGTGKTTLSLALAQSMPIRMSTKYANCRLIQIDAQSIFSKWFSESGKAVTKIFSTIEQLGLQDPNLFLFVLIDEVDTLAPKRQQTGSVGSGRDEARVVNALLVALDRVSRLTNVLTMCTTNFKEVLDPAFLDRVSEDYEVPKPGFECRYKILQKEYIRLADLDLVTGESAENMDYTGSKPFSVIECIASISAFQEDSEEAMDQISKRLRSLADICEGTSARQLHTLPQKSLAMFSPNKPCPIWDAIGHAFKYLKINPEEATDRGKK